MADPALEALRVARSAFDDALARVGEGDWSSPTLCDEWDVRQLVNHVVGQEYRYADNFATNDPAWYVAARDDDFLGTDPVAAWQVGKQRLDHALEQWPSLDAILQWRVPLPARDALAVRIFEAVVHSWDLSQALGVDAGIDEELAAMLVPLAQKLLQDPGLTAFFAPPRGELRPGASAQEHLLHLAGRG